jgi:diacylglycerol kinase (ATP)
VLVTPERRKTTLLQSFNHAFQGLVYAVRHQRNMRIHLVIAVGVMVGSVLLDLDKLQLVAVLLSVMFVLVTELINSAVETAVDMMTDQYDPRAKAAKDLSAGAVLVAAMNALVVAYLVLAERLTTSSFKVLSYIRNSPPHLTAIAFGVVMAAVIAVKAAQKKGTPLSGGLPSGHAALSFAGWTAITFVVGKYMPPGNRREALLVSAVGLVMAALVAQSRIETGIHSLLEVVLGALLGAVLTTLIFQLAF